MIVCEIISEYGGPHCSSTTSLLPKTGCSVVSLQEKGWDKSPSLSIVFGLSSKTQWLSGLYYADFISFYSPTQLCGGGTTKSNSNELPISVPLSRNRIPRKSLNYQSPYQVFLSYLKSLT